MIVHSVLVCVDCRTVNKPCNNPDHKSLYLSSKWRAPKKDNNEAWQRIANGEFLWDREAVRRKAIKKNRFYNERMFRGKEAVLEELERRLQAAQARKAEALKEIALGSPKCDHEWCLWSYKRAATLASNREAYEGCPRGPMETT